jgi:GNAT superfamily N-acetyltransferase
VRVLHGYRFDHRYREPVTLGDSSGALLRLLRADDKELIRRAFERLSDDGRYHRFFVRKRALLDGELRYLTELDQEDHVALVAVRGAPEEAMGVARAVRLLFEPDVYEVAVTVVDAFQRRGLGTLLVDRLRDAVTERGGSRLRFCVLPSNSAMQGFLRRAAPDAGFADEAGLLRLDLPPPVRPARTAK